MKKTIIKNIRKLGGESAGHVVIDGAGFIEQWGGGAAPNMPDAVMIDGGGHVIAPSFFDMRTTINNLSAADSLQRWSRVLFAAGVTHAVVVPSQKNLLDDAKSVRAFLSLTNPKNARDGDGGDLPVANLHCYGAMTRGLAGTQLSEYGLMGLAGALGFCDGDHNAASSEAFLQILRYAKNFNALILAHPEDPSLSNQDAVMTSSLLASRLGLPSAPAVSEAVQLQRDITLVGLVGGRYHAGPITTRAGVDIIRQAKKRGLAITADTAPHYFTLNETAIGHYLTHAKLSPPLRGEDDRQAVVEGIIDGTIDIIASDHKPLHDDKKRLPFASAVVGMASIETMLPLMITTLHHQHGMALEKIIAMVTTKPRELFAAAFGGKKNGEDLLAVGQPADMVLLDEKTLWKINSGEFVSPSKNTPFDGSRVQGRVVKTIKQGRVVFDMELRKEEIIRDPMHEVIRDPMDEVILDHKVSVYHLF
ncbi:MAG: dihydroorotase [Hydrotalea sp.]|nr:dihydroorotase [Hydrotalea sp.]